MLGVACGEADQRFSSGVNDINTNHHYTFEVMGSFNTIEILSNLSINLLQNVAVDGNFSSLYSVA
jgi:hypothetical protein